jgi:hypothetical protein
VDALLRTFYLAVQACSYGMESQLFALLVTAAILSWVAQRRVAAAAFTALGLLTRPEAVLLPLVFTIDALVARRPWRWRDWVAARRRPGRDPRPVAALRVHLFRHDRATFAHRQTIRGAHHGGGVAVVSSSVAIRFWQQSGSCSPWAPLWRCAAASRRRFPGSPGRSPICSSS